ncbi:MAG: bifunctional 5,10-methylenetetrahydrofolate dehydrogenase/5,10-methenyltetrahydrofolate cyclohydrolase [Candidatus Omnitrophota bacterium]
MTARILDGEVLAARIKDNLKIEIELLKKKGTMPRLCAVQVGENPASNVYTNQQKKNCEEMGISYELNTLPQDTSQDELIEYIEKLNNNKNINGIILQMPLPQQIDARAIQVKISPSKDVEGLHPANMGMLVYGNQRLAPPTALGAIELLKSSGVDLKGREVVIVGHSEIVGKPVALLLLQSQLESPTPTVCHIATKDLAFHTKRAEILIVAAGKAGLIRGDMIREGAIVIDIGINRVPVLDEKGNPVLNDKGKPKKRTVGDVEFEEAEKVCSYISPVPGGVGPLTVAMLIRNTLECVKLQQS